MHHDVFPCITLQTIAKATSPDVARTVARELEGATVGLSDNPTPRNRLVQVVGIESYQRIVCAFRKELEQNSVSIPKASTYARFMDGENENTPPPKAVTFGSGNDGGPFGRIPLQGVLFDIAEATSREVAETVARELGGMYLEISLKPTVRNRLTRAVGVENARRIGKALGYGRIYVPMAGGRGSAQRHAAVVKLAILGKSNSEIVDELGVSLSTVRRVRRMHRETIDRTRGVVGEANGYVE